MTWISVDKQRPPENQTIMTKIHDHHGARNEQPMVFWNNLWWHPDMLSYVYYTPTHWGYQDD